mmetsp:Transcript_24842/g.47026  ORF Transcript_24842/g.47026 Transcript_24842/m.47026 type:complete len:249 (-) Transcript_24842:1070-1816(-)
MRVPQRQPGLLERCCPFYAGDQGQRAAPEDWPKGAVHHRLGAGPRRTLVRADQGGARADQLPGVCVCGSRSLCGDGIYGARHPGHVHQGVCGVHKGPLRPRSATRQDGDNPGRGVHGPGAAVAAVHHACAARLQAHRPLHPPDVQARTSIWPSGSRHLGAPPRTPPRPHHAAGGRNHGHGGVRRVHAQRDGGGDCQCHALPVELDRKGHSTDEPLPPGPLAARRWTILGRGFQRWSPRRLRHDSDGGS